MARVVQQKYYKAVEKGQSVFDMTIQEYGSINALMLMLCDNPGINESSILCPGQKLCFRRTVPEEIISDQAVMNYFRDNRIRVNCDDCANYCVLIDEEGTTICTDDGFEIGII